jgi:hypothetical protein
VRRQKSDSFTQLDVDWQDAGTDPKDQLATAQIKLDELWSCYAHRSINEGIELYRWRQENMRHSSSAVGLCAARARLIQN